ncbi:MAG: CHAT domain-containing protein [Leptolyngbyaceae cyanobacterium bins.59]|nr:CHAT domain-containing protein [Leptolyngbyaceae cyanobacterium bins.59]
MAKLGRFLLTWLSHLVKPLTHLVPFRHWWLRGGVFALALGLTLLSPIVTQAQLPTPTPFQQGQRAYEAGRYSEALTLWQQAEAEFAREKDSLNRAMTLSNLSLAYQQLGQWSQAEASIAASLILVGPVPPANQPLPGFQEPDRLRVFAQVLNTLGRLQLTRGSSEQALETWQQATRLYNAVNDPTGSLSSQLNQVQALRSLGFYNRALAQLEALNQTWQTQPDTPAKVASLRSLGNAFRATGNFPKAWETLQTSLTIARKLDAAEEISTTLLSLGNTALDQPSLGNALELYQQSATIAPTPTLRLQAQLNQFSVLVKRQQFATAAALYPTLQTGFANLPLNHTTLYMRINLVNTLKQWRQGEGNTAPDWVEMARSLATVAQQAKTLGDPRAESYALGTLGTLYEQTRQWAEARTVTQQALALSQAISANDITYQWQWQLGRLLRTQGQTQPALVSYGQAVGTLQSIRNDLVTINSDVQFSFRESVEPVYRQYVSLLLRPENGQEPTQGNLETARSVIEALQLAELENFFQEACLERRPMTIDQIDPRAAIFYPIILEDRLEVVFRRSGQPLRHHAVPLPSNQVESTLIRLRQALHPVSPSGVFEQLSNQVYDWLIRPFEAELATGQVKTLVFVLDGPLRNFPMAALLDGDRFLIEKYGIAVTPGLELFSSQSLSRRNPTALTGGLSEARQGFSPLPKVEVELAEIREELPGLFLLNEDLTTQNLTRQLGSQDYEIVHLATHGQFSSDAEKTFILTWDSRIPVKQLDALLKQRSTRTRNPLELLVLSACQTAAGDSRAALGLAGVAVRSGARSTLATLWSVNDTAAATLMPKFYDELLQKGLTKAEALRQAQISLLKSEDFSLPYYWSAFVLIGNWL